MRFNQFKNPALFALAALFAAAPLTTGAPITDLAAAGQDSSILQQREPLPLPMFGKHHGSHTTHRDKPKPNKPNKPGHGHGGAPPPPPPPPPPGKGHGNNPGHTTPPPASGHPKVPLDLDTFGARGYVTKSEAGSGGSKVWEISTSHYHNGANPVDKIGVSADKKTLTVYEAFNGEDKTDKTKRLSMRDAMGAVAKKEGTNLKSLHGVAFSHIIHKKTKANIGAALKDMGKNSLTTETVIIKSGAQGKELNAFNKLKEAGTLTDAGVLRFSTEYGLGKTIKQFELSPTPGKTGFFNLLVVLN
ncbi:glycoprotein endopeptidase KAE1 [Apiospora arundinis]